MQPNREFEKPELGTFLFQQGIRKLEYRNLPSELRIDPKYLARRLALTSSQGDWRETSSRKADDRSVSRHPTGIEVALAHKMSRAAV